MSRYITHSHVHGDEDTFSCIEIPRCEKPVSRAKRRRRQPYGRRVGWTLYLFLVRRINRRDLDRWSERRRRHQERLTRGYNKKWKAAGWVA